MGIGDSYGSPFRQVGIYTGKILNGAKPAELLIVQSTKIKLVINQRITEPIRSYVSKDIKFLRAKAAGV